MNNREIPKGSVDVDIIYEAMRLAFKRQGVALLPVPECGLNTHLWRGSPMLASIIFDKQDA